MQQQPSKPLSWQPTLWKIRTQMLKACGFVVQHPVLCVTLSCSVLCDHTIPQYGMCKAEDWHMSRCTFRGCFRGWSTA